jgi:TRAP-type uncharacterized transport system fused permease subunit
MNTPELFLIILNVIFILSAYFYIYPKYAGSNGHKIAVYDAVLMTVAGLIAAYNFWGTEYQFNLLVADVDWFWFYFLTYFLLEAPVMLWYFKKYDVWKSFKE